MDVLVIGLMVVMPYDSRGHFLCVDDMVCCCIVGRWQQLVPALPVPVFCQIAKRCSVCLHTIALAEF